MAKATRIAKADTTSIGWLVRSFAFFGGAVCAVGLALSFIHTVLPLLQILTPLLVGWWLWQRYRKMQDRQQKRLRTVFYRLLRKHQGRMTLLDFAMTAKIPAIAARHYLDTRAKEFAARFEVTEHGDVVYVFSTLQWASSQPSVSESSVSKSLVSESSVSESSVSEALTVPLTDCAALMPTSLTQTELARRLGVAAKTVSRKKQSPLLSDWAQTRDPDGVGWSYSAQAQRFFPIGDFPVGDRVPSPTETARSD